MNEKIGCVEIDACCVLFQIFVAALALGVVHDLYLDRGIYRLEMNSHLSFFPAFTGFYIALRSVIFWLFRCGS